MTMNEKTANRHLTRVFLLTVAFVKFYQVFGVNCTNVLHNETLLFTLT